VNAFLAVVGREKPQVRQPSEEIKLSANKFIRVGGLQIRVIGDRKGTLVQLNGCLNIDSSPSLRDRLLTILQPEAPEVLTVDLSEVSHVDSSGIATLIEGLKIARTRNTTLSLKGLQGRLLHILEVTGIGALFGLSSHPAATSATRIQ
jgi:anti-sigma B factor antagonist